MIDRKLMFAITSMAAITMAMPAAAHLPKNLVAAGDFDIQEPYPIGFAQYFGGQSMGPWTVEGVDILQLDGAHSEGAGPPLYFNPNTGVSAIDLTGNGNTGYEDGIAQDIATIQGKPYKVSFFVGHQHGTGTFGHFYFGPSIVDLRIDHGSRLSFANSQSILNGITWRPFTTEFIAAGPVTSIEFLNGTPAANHYAGLDDVSVDPVPDAPTWAVMAVGLLALGAVLRLGRRLDGPGRTGALCRNTTPSIQKRLHRPLRPTADPRTAPGSQHEPVPRAPTHVGDCDPVGAMSPDPFG